MVDSFLKMLKDLEYLKWNQFLQASTFIDTYPFKLSLEKLLESGQISALIWVLVKKDHLFILQLVLRINLPKYRFLKISTTRPRKTCLQQLLEQESQQPLGPQLGGSCSALKSHLQTTLLQIFGELTSALFAQWLYTASFKSWEKLSYLGLFIWMKYRLIFSTSFTSFSDSYAGWLARYSLFASQNSFTLGQKWTSHLFQIDGFIVFQ